MLLANCFQNCQGMEQGHIFLLSQTAVNNIVDFLVHVCHAWVRARKRERHKNLSKKLAEVFNAVILHGNARLQQILDLGYVADDKRLFLVLNSIATCLILMDSDGAFQKLAK